MLAKFNRWVNNVLEGWIRIYVRGIVRKVGERLLVMIVVLNHNNQQSPTLITITNYLPLTLLTIPLTYIFT